MGYWKFSHSKIAAVRYCSENEPRVYTCSRFSLMPFSIKKIYPVLFFFSIWLYSTIHASLHYIHALPNILVY